MAEHYTIRPYTPSDRAACLAVYDSNLPHAMTLAERADYEQDLDACNMHYLVVVDDADQVVACGGFHISGKQASLCWGMVLKSHHGRGIGSDLLKKRLGMLREDGRVEQIRLDTTQFSRGFFEKHGFRLVRIIKDGYAPGIHHHDMVLDLTRA